MDELNKPLLLVLVLVAIAGVFTYYYAPARVPRPVTSRPPTATPEFVGGVPKGMLDAMKIRVSPPVTRQIVTRANLPKDVQQLIATQASYLTAQKVTYQGDKSGWWVSYLLPNGDFKTIPDQFTRAVLDGKQWGVAPLNSAYSPTFSYVEWANPTHQARTAFYLLHRATANARIAVVVEVIDQK